MLPEKLSAAALDFGEQLTGMFLGCGKISASRQLAAVFRKQEVTQLEFYCLILSAVRVRGDMQPQHLSAHVSTVRRKCLERRECQRDHYSNNKYNSHKNVFHIKLLCCQ